MAYQLQPGVKIIEDKAVPPERATDNFFAYPQPSSLNYAGRPQTMLWGTSPFKAGRGAPAHLIELDDQMRPQSTSRFNTKFAEPHRDNLHPLMDVQCMLPLRTQQNDPVSSRADLQNDLFAQRYHVQK